jgi:hypothetical protein
MPATNKVAKEWRPEIGLGGLSYLGSMQQLQNPL